MGTSRRLAAAALCWAAAVAAGAGCGESTRDDGPTPSGPEVDAGLFRPTRLVIGFFTQSRDFDGDPGHDGLEVRVQPIDRFGDPTKALGAYRIEVFEHRPRAGDNRGRQLGRWYVEVLDAASTRKYYDGIDRSYVFPLAWETPIEAGRSVVVQATFFPPEGGGERLVSQRVVRIGQS